MRHGDRRMDTRRTAPRGTVGLPPLPCPPSACDHVVAFHGYYPQAHPKCKDHK